LKQTLRATKLEIRQIKHNPAWNFKTRTKDPKFRCKIQREIETDLENAEWHLRSMNDLLTQLERDANRPVRNARRGRNRRSYHDDGPF
jgi:hypothetical protein